MNGSVSEHPKMLMVDVHHMTTQQLQQLGLSQLAYIKAVQVDGGRAWAIHAADGTPMALATDPASAVEAIHEHHMAAALVH